MAHQYLRQDHRRSSCKVLRQLWLYRQGLQKVGCLPHDTQDITLQTTEIIAATIRTMADITTSRSATGHGRTRQRPQLRLRGIGDKDQQRRKDRIKMLAQENADNKQRL